MNNIEILEEFIKHYKEVQEKYKDDEIQAEIERSCYFEEVPAEAIENLLQENKELNKQLNDIHSNFCKFNWKESNSKQVYNQLAELYESIYRKEK